MGADIAEFEPRTAEKIPASSSASSASHGEIAALIVAEERLAALAGPFHRPPEPPRRPGHQRELGIERVAGAEIAADVARRPRARAPSARRARWRARASAAPRRRCRHRVCSGRSPHRSCRPPRAAPSARRSRAGSRSRASRHGRRARTQPRSPRRRRPRHRRRRSTWPRPTALGRSVRPPSRIGHRGQRLVVDGHPLGRILPRSGSRPRRSPPPRRRSAPCRAAAGSAA